MTIHKLVVAFLMVAGTAYAQPSPEHVAPSKVTSQGTIRREGYAIH